MIKVVFIGSGPVAAQALSLLQKSFEIEAVITKPKPAHHKGNFPVLDVSEDLGLHTILVSNKKELDYVVEKTTFESDIAVLVDFGIIVSQKAIDAFPLGIVNSHFSLLPEWRGADPISFAVLSGQKKTGVSLMLLVEAMDEGPLLAQAEYGLSDTVTTPELTNELIKLSDDMLAKTLPLYIEGETHPAPQELVTIASSKKPSYSRKLTKADGQIDWNKPAKQIEREVRAYLGWPGSKTTLANKEVTITQAKAVDANGTPGQVGINDDQLLVHCGKGSLLIKKLKPAGKNEMTAQEFTRGYGSRL